MKRSVLISAVIGIALLLIGPAATAQQRGKGGRSAGNQQYGLPIITAERDGYIGKVTVIYRRC